MSGWGLFFNNDNGYSFNQCMEVVGGSEVIFPVLYQTGYAADAENYVDYPKPFAWNDGGFSSL